jgi:hypothetical protein
VTMNADKMKERMTRMTSPREKKRVPVIPSPSGEPVPSNRAARRALARQQRKAQSR